MENDSSDTGDVIINDGTVSSRLEIIDAVFKNTNLDLLLNFNDDKTLDEQEKKDSRKVLKKKILNFDDTILSIYDKDKQVEYIASGTYGHVFKSSVQKNDKKYDYAIKVVPYIRKFGEICDITRPENAEINMLKVLSKLVLEDKTPHIILPIAAFDTNIDTFVDDDMKNVVGESMHYQNFLDKYKSDHYDKKYASVLLCEWSNRNNLMEFIKNNNEIGEITKIYWKVFFFQILSTLAIIQEKYPTFRHNSFKANDILLDKIDNMNAFFCYKVAEKKYTVPNIGYQIKLWDFDFACIPGIVDNMKVDEDWANEINITKTPNRYHDIHHFFNTFIVVFYPKLMSDPNVPKEVVEFINRVVPKKYQKHPNVQQITNDTHIKLIDKYSKMLEEYKIENKNSDSEQEPDANFNKNKKCIKYKKILDDCKDNNYVEDYVYGVKIPEQIKNDIIELLPSNHGINIGVVSKRGRLLINDEYLTAREIIEKDPFFSEFRYVTIDNDIIEI
jgi:hypothetical protein